MSEVQKLTLRILKWTGLTALLLAVSAGYFLGQPAIGWLLLIAIADYVAYGVTYAVIDARRRDRVRREQGAA